MTINKLSNKALRLSLVAASLVLASSNLANATVISSGTNNPLAFTWSFTTPTSSVLTGNGSLSVSGFNSSSLTVTASLTNTSLLGGQGGERLTAFGFGIDPNATGVSFSDDADNGMVGAVLGATFPSLATIEVCAFGGPNCAGGGTGGIFGAGGSDTFSILLAGTWGNSVDIAPIGFKYQTGYGSFEFTASSTGGQSTSGQSTSGTSVPEPGMLGLLGIGLLGQALLLRQRRRRLQK